MKKVSWNTESLNIAIALIGDAPFMPSIDPSALIGSDDHYFTARDEDGVEVLCKNTDEGESPEALDMIYEEGGIQFTATAKEFIGSHPPHRPK